MCKAGVSGAGAVPVVFGVDKNYIQFLPVTLQSIMDNADSNRHYVIHIISTDEEVEKSPGAFEIRRQVAPVSNFSLKFQTLPADALKGLMDATGGGPLYAGYLSAPADPRYSGL